MAVIRLRTENVALSAPPIRFLDEQGQERQVPLLRVRTRIWIGKDPPPSSRAQPLTYSATLDTGAPVTVIPKRVWQDFASEIGRLRIVGSQPAVGRVGGRHFSYFLGRVWVGVIDMFDRRLPAVPVPAQFREDDIPLGEPQPPILLGLWGGILEGRHLTRWPTAERHDPDMPTLESFGQWWHLAEP